MRQSRLTYPSLVLMLVASASHSVYAQVTPPAPPGAIPAPPGQAGAPIALSTTPGAPAQAVPQVPTGPIDLPVNESSIFYSADQISALSKAKGLHSRAGGDGDLYDEEDLLNQLRSIKLVDATKDVETVQHDTDPYYTQFFVESIAYHAPNDWAVWMRENNKSRKITPTSPQEPNERLKILAIGKEEVTFGWAPLDWEKASQAYAAQSYGPDDIRITLDEAAQTVKFTMHANQTMLSQTMQIVEGPRPVVAKPVDKDSQPLMGQDGKIVELFGAGDKNAPAQPPARPKRGAIKNYQDLDKDMKP